MKLFALWCTVNHRFVTEADGGNYDSTVPMLSNDAEELQQYAQHMNREFDWVVTPIELTMRQVKRL